MTDPTRAGRIERLLRPRSVAIVGASATPGALGASVLRNLTRLGFAGDIHLINPNRADIAGRACLKSIDELPPGVDAAVLAIPRAGVLEAVRALAAREVGAAVIFSAGFAEAGDTGRAEQREIADIAAANGMLIEGPNCLGYINHVDGVALTFVETSPIDLHEQPGIGIVSQSGAMACVLGTMLASRELGISCSISTGNEAVSGVEDFLEYLIGEAHTRVLGMIVEQFRPPHVSSSSPAGRASSARESSSCIPGAVARRALRPRLTPERWLVIMR